MRDSQVGRCSAALRIQVSILLRIDLMLSTLTQSRFDGTMDLMNRLPASLCALYRCSSCLYCLTLTFGQAAEDLLSARVSDLGSYDGIIAICLHDLLGIHKEHEIEYDIECHLKIFHMHSINPSSSCPAQCAGRTVQILSLVPSVAVTKPVVGQLAGMAAAKRSDLMSLRYLALQLVPAL